MRAPLRTIRDVRRWSTLAENGCWVWDRAVSNYGYGIAWDTATQRPVKAHRFAYEQVHGTIPVGMVLDHLCRNRACVNPDHLEAVTNAENIRRGVGKAAGNVRKTHCPQGHPYAGENLRISANGDRICRACVRERSRARRMPASDGALVSYDGRRLA